MVHPMMASFDDLNSVSTVSAMPTSGGYQRVFQSPNIWRHSRR